MSAFERITTRRLAELTKTTENRLRALAKHPAAHYRRQPHCGRNGKRRILMIPSPELRRVQRCLLRDLLDRLKPHPSAACVRDRGTVWMMHRHKRHPFLLSLDIQDFFPSVSRSRVSEGLARLGLGDAKLLSSLLTVNGELPQGAPTSVAIGDIALFPLDNRIGGLARAEGLVYSRYIDDLIISGGSRIRDRFQKVIVRFAEEEGWRLNEKGGLVGPGERRLVLGAIVNVEPKVSQRYFSDVRFYLRMIERGHAQPTSKEMNRLRSRVAWIGHVNPTKGQALEPHLARAIAATETD
ncbi:MAG: reverse transcriptase family protein [Gammaproteobacteria bacterium]|nr:reverse transcriptase family protein [Gammaproteobacteria bacterium]